MLNFPYKDCILKGAQDKDSTKSSEIFFNEILGSDEVDVLLKPKALQRFELVSCHTELLQKGEVSQKSSSRDISASPQYDNIDCHESANADSRNDNASDSSLRGDLSPKQSTHLKSALQNKPNLLIKGNNLLALHSLKSRCDIYGQVKLIYIDPPYNTGNDSFNYNDRFNHSAWLTFMKNRLEIAREFLREDGVIFVQCDDNEQAYLKVLMDEIFGRENFVATICWEKKYSPANDAKWLSDNHDFILLYAKRKESWKPNLLPRTEEMNARYTNPDNDPRGRWKTGGFSVKTYTANYDYPITTPSGKIVYPPSGSCWQTSKENYEKMLQDNRIYFGKNGDSKPQIKQFLSEVQQGVVTKTFWKYDECGHNQIGKQEIKALFACHTERSEVSQNSNNRDSLLSTKAQNDNVSDSRNDKAEVFSRDFSGFGARGEGSLLDINDRAPSEQSAKSTEKTTLFATPKPEALLKRIIEISTNEGDLVMDFFAGSGTTCAVAHKMKRRWVGIEQMDYVESITKARLIKVINGEQGGVSKAVGWNPNSPSLAEGDKGGGYKNAKDSKNAKFANAESALPLTPSAGEGERKSGDSAREGEQDSESHAKELPENSFIYCELMPLNALYKQRIMDCHADARDDELSKIYKDLQEKAFIDYRVDIKAMLKDKDFEALNLNEKKRILCEILDSNMDYVLYSDIEDSEYGIDDEIIELNKVFYGDL